MSTDRVSGSAKQTPGYHRTMRHDDVLKVMTFSLGVGADMLESSVAISDVEETVRRLTSAFGLGRCEVSVTLNVVTVSYLDSTLSDPITMIKVVDLGEPRLDRLAALDTVARRVESGELDIDAAIREVDVLHREDRTQARWVTSLAGLVSVAAWVVFAGGGLIGAASAVLAGLVIEFIVGPLARSRIPGVFGTVVAAAVAVATPSAFAWADIPIALTPAIVGGLYPLLPGGALVASVTDGLSGAPVSSMAKGLQSAIAAAAIAIGAIAALTLSARLEITSDVVATPAPAALKVAAGAVAVMALAVARSMPRRFVPSVGLIAVAVGIAAESWEGDGPTVALSTFGAAVVLGLAGQILARLHRTTATVFSTTAVYVLVPGVTFYLAMLAFAQGESALGIDLTVQALGIAAALAAGIALGLAIGRAVPAPRPPAVQWRRAARRSG